MRAALKVGFVGFLLLAGCAARPAGSSLVTDARPGAEGGLDAPLIDVVVRQGSHIVVTQAARTRNCPNNSAERGHAIASDAAGNVLAVFYELAADGSLTFRVRRMDPNGAQLWSRTFAGVSGSSPVELRIARSGDLLAVTQRLAMVGR